MNRLSIISLLCVVFFVSGCEQSLRQVESENKQVEVKLVTTFDGVKLYRVYAGDHIVFVAVAEHNTSAEWREQEGKTTVRRQTMTVERQP